MDVSQKKQSILVFLTIILSAILGTLEVSIIIPFMSVIMDAEKYLDNKYVVYLFGLLHISRNTLNLTLCICLLVIIVYVVKNIILVWADYAGIRFENKIQKDFSALMLKSYVYRSYEDNLNINSAEVLRGIGADATALYYMMQSTLKGLTNILTLGLIGLFLVSTNPLLACEILVLAGGLSLGIIFLLKKTVSRSGKAFNDSMLNQSKTAMQALGGLKESIIMNRREKFLSYNEEALEMQRKAQIKYRFLQILPSRVIETAFISCVIGIVCVRIIGGLDVANMVPQLATFAYAAFRMLPQVNGIIGLNTSFLYYMPSFQNAYTNIKASRSFLEDKSEGKTMDCSATLTFQESIRLDNIYWKYRKSDDSIFEGLNLEIKKGKAIGIIGPSGAGKTTLVDIILGLLVPQKGKVLLDGKDIGQYYEQWSNMVGYVPQTVYLLDDTIRNNIFFGIDEKERSEERVWNVVKEACLKEFVESLPDGLDTIVGERGARISGGQRQRIAIARALYYNPQILVLDEATSALDQETESAVMEAVDRLQGKMTLIIIAHRITTLKKCDEIYEVRDGKAVRTVLP